MFNPYAPSKDSFFGEKRIEELNIMARQIISNGYSYVVLAGDKMGKTSFLLKLKDNLENLNTQQMKLLTIYLNLSHMMPLSPYVFLQEILNSIIKQLNIDIHEEEYKLREGMTIKSLFDDFIDRKLKNLLREGEDIFEKVRLVLLIDDAKHLVTGQEWSEAMYHQLRYLFVDSPLSNKISTVLTGFRRIRDLREEVGSPFNHMQTRLLKGLSEEDCNIMIRDSLSDSFSHNVIEKIYNLTGGHVFLLNLLFSNMIERGRNPDINMIEEISREIHMDNIFEGWYKKLNDLDKNIFILLAGKKEWVSEDVIRNSYKTGWKDSIDVISTMGLIQTKIKEHNTYYKATGKLFIDWFLNSAEIPEVKDISVPEKHIEKPGSQKFFIYRNGKQSLEDSPVARQIVDDSLSGKGHFKLIIDRVFSESLIDRDKKISINLPGKIGLEFLSHLAINRGIFQNLSQIGYALWQEEFIPKANIQNIKSIIAKELNKKEINMDKIVIAKRGGYIFSEEIDVCVITPAIIRCKSCGNPSDINMNSGRCTNNDCNATLY